MKYRPEIDRRAFLTGEWGRSNIDQEVKRKIAEVLGVETELAFRFGNHVFEEADRKRIFEEGIELVLGEVDIWMPQYAALSDEEVEGVTRTPTWTDPGVGGSVAEVKIHKTVIREMLAKGVVLAATDSSIDFDGLKSRMPIPAQALVRYGSRTMEAGAGLSYVGLGIGYIIQRGRSGQDEQLNRRQFIRFGTAMGACMAVWWSGILGDGWLNEPVTNLVDEWLNDPEFVPLNRGMVKLRNKIMALNTWQTLEKTKNGRGLPKKSLFFAGNGHDNARNEFLKGPEKLEMEVAEFAKRLVGVTFDTLLTEVKDSEMVAKIWKYYGDFFSHPQQIGKELFEVEVWGRGKVKNAQTVLFEVAVGRIEELVASGEVEKADLLRRMIMENVESGWRAGEETRKVVAETMGWEKEEMKVVADSSLSTVSELATGEIGFQNQVWLKGNLLTGAAMLGGDVWPKMLSFWQGEEGGILGGESLLGASCLASFNLTNLRRLSAEEVAGRLPGKGIHLRFDERYGEWIGMVVDLNEPNSFEKNDYFEAGEGWPAGIVELQKEPMR